MMMLFGRFCLLVLCIATIAPASADIALRLQGSNTIGAKLAPALAKAFLEQRGVAQVSVQPTAVENEFLVSGSERRDGATQTVGITVAAHGSATGFQALATQQADIALASRPIKADERALLLALGDMESPAAEHAMALDGLAILVNTHNPVKQLSREQIAGLFSGAIRNWSQLGGADLPVTIYARDDRSGTWETFKELVLGKTYQLSNLAQRFESNDKLSEAVAAEPGAIGFSGLASIGQAKALAVADGGAQSLRPVHLTVATEDYALSRRLYLYVPPRATAGIVREFVDFCLSEAGQRIVAEKGFVSQNIEVIKQEIPANAPLEYRDIAGEAQRLSVNFRFKEGNSLLDNKARRDIGRLTEFLLKPENKGRRVYLVGFSDIEKNQKMDRVISRFRALAVRAALMQRDVPIFQIEGFGAFMPVAESAEVAAAKNGRVEVWLGPAG
jgi:phosphate transport system substrate-binding protein